MATYQDLANHLANDPDNRGYAGMSAEQVVADLKIKRHPGDVRLGFIGLVSKVGTTISTKLFGAMDSVAADTNNPNHFIISKIMKILESGGDLNVNDPVTRAFIDLFVAGGALTQQEGDAIKALADNQTSDEEKYNLGRVKVGHVLAARGN